MEAQTIYPTWIQVIKDLMVRNEDQARVSEPWQQFLQAMQQALGSGIVEMAPDKDLYESGAAKYIGYVKEDKQITQYVLAPEKVLWPYGDGWKIWAEVSFLIRRACGRSFMRQELVKGTLIRMAEVERGYVI